MDTIHSPQEVAESIKNHFRKNKISIDDVAEKFGVTPHQIYNILNGKQYLSPIWGQKFEIEYGIKLSYSFKGGLPMFDQKTDSDRLIEAVKAYRAAEDLEERFIMELDKRDKENISEIEKEILTKLTKEKKECRNILDRLIDQYDIYNIERQKYNGKTKETETKIIKNKSPLKLHEAIKKVIRESGRPLTFIEIATAINQQKLYFRGDGNDVPSGQICARVRNYEKLFEVTTIDGVKHVNNKQ